MPFQQVTIVGTGLIGGSFALALKKNGFRGRIVGCDRPPVLQEALRRGVIDEGIEDLVRASKGSDLIVLATPVGTIIDILEQAPLFPPNALITDVGSTKFEVMARARSVLGEAASRRFLPGHPMSGKEYSGIEQADGELFRNAVWIITPYPGQDLEHGSHAEYLQWLVMIGARLVFIDDPDRHDRICSWVSHLPQMLATAFAAMLEDEFGDDTEPRGIGGRALREITRIAASPYSMWRDVALTNTAHIQEAMLRLEQRLAHLRENLRTRELQAEFERGNRFKLTEWKP